MEARVAVLHAVLVEGEPAYAVEVDAGVRSTDGEPGDAGRVRGDTERRGGPLDERDRRAGAFEEDRLVHRDVLSVDPGVDVDRGRAAIADGNGVDGGLDRREVLVPVVVHGDDVPHVDATARRVVVPGRVEHAQSDRVGPPRVEGMYPDRGRPALDRPVAEVPDVQD